MEEIISIYLKWDWARGQHNEQAGKTLDRGLFETICSYCFFFFFLIGEKVWTFLPPCFLYINA